MVSFGMKWLFRIVLGLLLLAVVAFFGSAFFLAQRADYSWRPRLSAPLYPNEHSRVLIDGSHHNGSSARFYGRYWPFARLLRAAGYEVTISEGPFLAPALAGVDVLIIANPSGGQRLQAFGINLPIGHEEQRSKTAFSPAEISAVHEWVSGGGSLLLVADHAPFGEAAASLAEAFGVVMHKGFVEVAHESSDPLLFSSKNQRLGDHAIISGGRGRPRISRVMTYTGQSLTPPAGATILLRLPDGATESVPAGESLRDERAGPAQGLAMEVGRGRVVMLGEAAMLTAQVNERVPFGMNTNDNDNETFALNMMEWLLRRL